MIIDIIIIFEVNSIEILLIISYKKNFLFLIYKINILKFKIILAKFK